jgi:hypothetical protein
MRVPEAVAGGKGFSLGDVKTGGVRGSRAALGVLGAVVASLYEGQLAEETDEELMK